MIARPTTTCLKEMPALTAGTAAVWLAVAVAVSIGAVAQVAAPAGLIAGSEAFGRFHHDPPQRALAILLEQIQQAAGKNKLGGKGALSASPASGHWASPLIQREPLTAWPLAIASGSRQLPDVRIGHHPQREILSRRINLPPPMAA